MGDKSPKSVQKKSSQKQSKVAEVAKNKQASVSEKQASKAPAAKKK